MVGSKNTEIVGPNESGHSVDIGGLPEGALKEIIKKLNEKSQRSTKIYNENYRVEIRHLKNLFEKIRQEFHNCTIIDISDNISLFLSKNQRIDFKSWPEFEEFDTTQSSRTKSISLEITFDVIRIPGGLPERYVIQVSIQNSPRDFGVMIGNVGLQRADSFGVPPVPIFSSIGFNNFIIGKNISNTIDEWEKSLPKQDRKFINIFQKYSDRMRSFIVFLGAVSGVLFSRVFIDEASGGIVSLNSLVYWIIYSALGFILFYSLGVLCGREAERMIDRHAPKNNITFTDGYRNRDYKLSKENRKYLIKSIVFISIVIFELIIATSAENLFDKLF